MFRWTMAYTFALTSTLQSIRSQGNEHRESFQFSSSRPHMVKTGSPLGPPIPRSILSVAATFLRSPICVDLETRRAKRRGLVHAWGETARNWSIGRHV